MTISAKRHGITDREYGCNWGFFGREGTALALSSAVFWVQLGEGESFLAGGAREDVLNISVFTPR